MLHAVSKLLWFVAQPSMLLGLVAVTGLALALCTSRVRLGLRIAGSGMALLLALGMLPLSTLLLLPLEQRFPRLTIADGSRDWAGIIVLGGGEDPIVSAARGQLHLNEAAERITEGGMLALRLPSTRLVFTGGAGLVLMPNLSGVDSVSAYWQATGIARDRILLDGISRNTYENAILTRNLVKPKLGERWLLVTSAAHMPRSIGVFRRAGFDVVAYPVDFRSAGTSRDLLPFHSFPSGLKRLDDVSKEWAGLLATWLLGRSSALFPGPG